MEEIGALLQVLVTGTGGEREAAEAAVADAEKGQRDRLASSLAAFLASQPPCSSVPLPSSVMGRGTRDVFRVRGRWPW